MPWGVGSKKVMEEMNTPKPNNYLALAIFTTVCCCLPAGIYAIIRAMKVNDYYMMKQYEEATLAANDAKKWSIIGIVGGAIVSILYLVFCGGLAALGSPVSYTHLRAHETLRHLVCRLLLEKKKI